jgi:two-component system, NarL family, invasion response regulator UvrY
MTAKHSILIIDDHAVVRAGCRLLLDQREGAGLIEASTGEEGLRLNSERKPGLIILDLGLKDASGLELIKQIRAANSRGAVLIFTMYEDPVLAVRAMESGASGYVTKNEGPAVFLAAVDQLLNGGSYLSHGMAQKIALLNIRSGQHPLRGLTAREIDVLRLLGEGKSPNEIASALNISYRTVANTIALMKRKLGVATTGLLIRTAIEQTNPSPCPSPARGEGTPQ